MDAEVRSDACGLERYESVGGEGRARVLGVDYSSGLAWVRSGVWTELPSLALRPDSAVRMGICRRTQEGSGAVYLGSCCSFPCGHVEPGSGLL